MSMEKQILHPLNLLCQCLHFLVIYYIERIITIFYLSVIDPPFFFFLAVLLFVSLFSQLNSEFLGISSAMRNDGEPILII